MSSSGTTVRRPAVSTTTTLISSAWLRWRLSTFSSLLPARTEPAEKTVATRFAPDPLRVADSVWPRKLQLLLGTAAAERTDTPRERRATLMLLGSLTDTLRSAGPPGARRTTRLSRGRLRRKPLPVMVAVGGQPTTVTGAAIVAPAPLWAPNTPVAVRFGPVQRFWLAVSRPCGPPSITSVNVDSGTSGRPLKTFCTRPPTIAALPTSVNGSVPPNFTATPGRPVPPDTS